MIAIMIKNAMVTEDTPSIVSGRRGTHDVYGESVCVDEEKNLDETPETMSKSANFKELDEKSKETKTN